MQFYYAYIHHRIVSLYQNDVARLSISRNMSIYLKYMIKDTYAYYTVHLVFFLWKFVRQVVVWNGKIPANKQLFAKENENKPQKMWQFKNSFKEKM